MVAMVAHCSAFRTALSFSMKEDTTHSPGKIEENTEGLGVVSPGQVEERARELAVIDGRSVHAVTDADREQARRELLGEEPENGSAPEDGMVPAGSWSEEPGTRGHETPAFLPEDEAGVPERLVAEGMDEALHDEMLEARKKNIDAAS